MNGHTELHATLRGPLKDPQQIEAHVEIPVLQVGYEKIELAAAAPIRADYANGMVTLQPAEIKGTGTDLRFREMCHWPAMRRLRSVWPAMSICGCLQILEPDLESHGQLQFDIRSQGRPVESESPWPNPHCRCGTGAIQRASGPAARQRRAHFAEQSARCYAIPGTDRRRDGDGAGRNRLRDKQFSSISAPAANEAQLVYQGLRIVLDGNLALTGTPQAAVLSGQVNVERVSAAPDFDLTNLREQARARWRLRREPGLSQDCNAERRRANHLAS